MRTMLQRRKPTYAALARALRVKATIHVLKHDGRLGQKGGRALRLFTVKNVLRRDLW